MDDGSFKNELETAIRHVYEQGSRSHVPSTYDENNKCLKIGGCKYLHPDGRRCAIGWLMTDDELTRFVDTLGGVGMLQRMKWREGQYTLDQLNKLQALQAAHDRCRPPDTDSASDFHTVVEYEPDDFRKQFIIRLIQGGLENFVPRDLLTDA